MQPRTAFLGTLLLSAALIAASPRVSLSPGPMTRGHGDIASDCLGCHTPLRGLPAARCIACHPLDSIGTTADTAVAQMHRSFVRPDCLECHSDHAGTDPANATREFAHAVLRPDLGERCTVCHGGNLPGDELHRAAGDDCGACHAVKGWKPATFDHRQFATRQSCTACHTRQRPRDELHRQVSDDCAACHATDSWENVRFDHTFPLDHGEKGRIPCRSCHEQPRDWKSYTCYGCHEHTPERIRQEHMEEGIGRNLADCVRCHATGQKEEGGEGEEGEKHEKD